MDMDKMDAKLAEVIRSRGEDASRINKQLKQTNADLEKKLGIMKGIEVDKAVLANIRECSERATKLAAASV
jgi:hypothetical protein